MGYYEKKGAKVMLPDGGWAIMHDTRLKVVKDEERGSSMAPCVGLEAPKKKEDVKP